MTNNPTIDGVSLALLNLCYRALNGGDNQLSGMEHGQAFRELRALLDADKVNNRQMGIMQFVEAHPIAPVVERQPVIADDRIEDSEEEAAMNASPWAPHAERSGAFVKGWMAKTKLTQSTIAQLQAENARIKSRLCVCSDCGGQGEVYSGHSSYQGHNQPPEPDMDVCGTCGGDGVLGPLEDFEALASERDQLQARVAELESEEPEWSAMQQRLGDENTQLRSRIAELESARGEPVCYQARHSAEEPWFFTDKPGYWEWRPLFTAPPAFPTDLLQRLAYALSQVGKADHLVDYDAVILAREDLRACLDATAALNGPKS